MDEWNAAWEASAETPDVAGSPVVAEGSVHETILAYAQTVPVDLDAMARALRLYVVDDLDLPPSVAGKIERRGTGYQISVNGQDPYARRRFTLAHEIAHYALHRDLIGDGITDDVLYRSSLSSDIETDANRFAAAILMPAKLVRQVWREGERSMVGLTRRFGVSEDAMRIRLQSLRLAP